MHIATKILLSDFDTAAATDADILAIAQSLQAMVKDQITRLHQVGLITEQEEALV